MTLGGHIHMLFFMLNVQVSPVKAAKPVKAAEPVNDDKPLKLAEELVSWYEIWKGLPQI